MTIEVGDLVYLKAHSADTVGVVMNIYSPAWRRNSTPENQDGFKPRAKILMFNGKTYDFVIEDLIIKAKGDNHESI